MNAPVKLQDLPPSGGYKPINFKRVPAKTYFKGRTLIAGYLGMTIGAAYLMYLNHKYVYRHDIEQRSCSMAITPLMLAERDREFLKQIRRNRDEEAKLMANVEGWVVGTWYGEPIYKTVPEDTFISPTACEYYVHADFNDFKKRGHLTFMS